MKKLIAILLCLCFCVMAFAACDNQPADNNNNNNDNPSNSETPNDPSEPNDPSDPTDPGDPTDPDNSDDQLGDDMIEDNKEPVLDLTKVDAIKPSTRNASDSYTISGGDELMSYFEKTLDDFYGTCKYYQENQSYTLYSYHIMNGNHFATYQKGVRLVHVYWIECESELNIVTSTTGGAALPPKEPAVTTGSFKTSVTQIQSPAINGMGYVIQLADGSFIIQDGGRADRADEIWNTLVKLNNNSERNIVIRAWVLTHAHGDHYPCFGEFGTKYGSKVTLETLMISPVSDADATAHGATYFSSAVKNDLVKFSGAKLLYVHTGMVFNFCNVKFEILFTADELWISDPKCGEGLGTLTHFNNSSITSRIYTDDYSCMFLGDATDAVGMRMAIYYEDYLKSDMCQMAHHGVEDYPLITYRFIKPAILWYPCSESLYSGSSGKGRDDDVREALKNSKYTEEIILQQYGTETRYFKTAE